MSRREQRGAERSSRGAERSREEKKGAEGSRGEQQRSRGEQRGAGPMNQADGQKQVKYHPCPASTSTL